MENKLFKKKSLYRVLSGHLDSGLTRRVEQFF